MKKQRKAHWVEVRNKDNERWVKRIAVDLQCNPILCVYIDDEEEYLNFRGYQNTEWNQWRETEKPELNALERYLENIEKENDFEFPWHFKSYSNWVCLVSSEVRSGLYEVYRITTTVHKN